MLRSLLVLIASLIVLSACTEHAPAIYDNAPDTRQPQPVTTAPADATTEPRIQEFNLKFSQAQDPLREVVAPLAETVLGADRLSDPATVVTPADLDDLMLLNALVLRLKESDFSRPEFSRVADLYQQALDFECDGIKASCRGLRYLRQAGNTSQVIKILARLRPASAAHLVLAAVDTKNAEGDPDLIELIMQYVPASLSKQAHPDAVASYLDAALVKASEGITGSTEARRFLKKIQAWKFITSPTWDMGPSARNALWHMIGRGKLFYQDDGSLDPEFKALMDKNNALTGSLAERQNQLREEQLFHPEAVGAAFVTRFDELYFLVDSVYNQTLDTGTAADIFASLDRPAADLANAISGYARMRFAFALGDSTKIARDIFTAAIPTSDLLRYAIRQSPAVRRLWGNVESHLDDLRTFSAAAVKPKPGGVLLEQSLRNMFDSFNRSVRIVSVYPHTLLLLYYLSEKHFTISLDFNSKTYDTGDLLTLQYYGYLPQLLPYTDDQVNPTHFEMMYAFDMAVRSNLLPAVGVDVDHFMSETLRRLNEKPVEFVQTHLDDVAARFQESRLTAEFRNACEEFKTGKKIPRTLGLADLHRSPYYGNLMSDMFLGVSSKGGSQKFGDGSLFQSDMGLLFFDAEFSETLEKARLDLAEYERIGMAMLTSYESYLRQYEHMTPEQIAEKTVATRAEIKRAHDLRMRTLNAARDWFTQFGKCYYPAGAREWRVVVQMVRTEEQYLRQVHRDIVKLRQWTTTDADREKILAKYRFTGLPSNYKGMDLISAGGYRATQMDFLIRAAGYLKNGLKTDTVTMPAVAPTVSVELGSKLDLDVDYVRSGNQQWIPFTESEDDFVASGLHGMFGSIRDGFTSWITMLDSRLGYWDHYIKTLSSMYRLERDLGVAPKVTPEDILDAHAQLLVTSHYTEDDRWLMGMFHRDFIYAPLAFGRRVVSYNIDASFTSFKLQDYWGLFDLPFRAMNAEKIGYDYDNRDALDPVPFDFIPKRFGFEELGNLYYRVRAKWIRGEPFVPYSTDLDHFLDADMRALVTREAGAIQTFHRTAATYTAALSKLPEDERPYVDLTLDNRITGPMFTPSYVTSWDSDFLDFNRSTQSCLMGDCTDFH